MALLKMLVGGTIGFGVQLFANAIAKIPLSRSKYVMW